MSDVTLAAVPATPAASKRLALNVVALAGGQVVTWSMALLWTLVIPRAIGPASMGFLVTAWAATGIMAVLSGLGTRTFLVKEIAANPQTAASLLGTALVLRLILIVPAVAANPSRHSVIRRLFPSAFQRVRLSAKHAAAAPTSPTP